MVSALASVLMVIAEKGFRDEEFSIPLKILRSAGHKVEVASTSANVAEGKLGMKVKPDMSIDAVDPDRYDAVVVVGGPGTPSYIWPNKKLQRVMVKVYEKGGVVAAICLAPAVLARADLLKGKKATIFRTAESVGELEVAGCSLQGDHVVVDGRIITADGPDAAKPFGDALVKLLK
jgi:protease I